MFSFSISLSMTEIAGRYERRLRFGETFPLCSSQQYLIPLIRDQRLAANIASPLLPPWQPPSPFNLYISLAALWYFIVLSFFVSESLLRISTVLSLYKCCSCKNSTIMYFSEIYVYCFNVHYKLICVYIRWYHDCFVMFIVV